EIVAVGPPFTRWLGLAVDVGTTKVAGYLLDMETGHTLASKGMMNPQISYGEDVVSRIVAASKSSADAHKLQSLLVDAINQLAADLCAESDAKQEEIADAVIVGNTAIHHLFLGLPVRQLGLSPYIPAVDDAVDLKARDLGVHIAQGAYIHLLPNIAGYVGADHVSMMLATRLEEAKEITLAIDIGTNTEICLNYSGKLTSVSCASGPAFEGAHIKFGMRAAPGAIEHVRLDNNQLEIQTIGNEPAVGICGSGLLDVVAQLRENDIVDRSGKMGEHPRIQRQTGKSEFILAERDGLDPVTISQKDVRELQLAKAAIRLGIQALVDGAGLQEKDIERVIIAGAFGTFIDVKSAITIGMLPDLPLERFTQVGNAAGTGARLALVSKTERQRAKQIAIRDGYIELAKVPDFSRKFARATYF
ncbi:MAG: ASKHA domain-containing protein, partial [Anaerolineales bacterium]